MAKNKTLKVLSTGTVAGMIAAAVLSSQAFAAVDAYSVKIGDDVLKYDKAALTESFLASKAGEAAPLYEDFTAKLTEAKGFYAFSDAKTGKFVSYDDIQAKFLEAKAAGEAFVVDAYTESVDAKVIEVPTVKKVVVKDGKIVVETEGQVTGELKVTSVSAINANSFKVVFNKAVEDTSKISLAVKQSGVAVTVATTWNTAKTEATLTKSSKLVAGNYEVSVKNDATDLGSSTVAISEQKVAKIEIISNKLGIYTDSKTQEQSGYATYRVLDQYGEDITNSAVANNISFQTGVGAIDNKDGLITVTPSTGLNLLTFTGGIVITATDTSTGVATTANLTATSQIGTLSDIQLSTLTNAENKTLTAGDTTTIFYAEFVATDLSGNTTSNYTLMKQGLILSGDNKDELTTSSPYVTAKLVQDPKDSKKALIEVRATDKTIQTEMPVVITAMTWTGKTSQISTTIKKQAQLDKMTLMAPDYAIASTESKVIPFIAYDQNGKELTKATDILTHVNFSDTIITDTDVNGNLVLKNKPVTNNTTTSVPQVLTVTTQTGKFSSITINIQKAVKADTLSLDTNVLLTNLQAGASQSSDFGWDEGGFTVKDQYGRDINLNSSGSSNYAIFATSSDTSVITAVGTGVNGYLTKGNTQMNITAVAVGSATVRFDLYDLSTGKVVDSKSQTFTVVKNDDIKDYTIDTLSGPIYVVNGNTAATGLDTLTDYEMDYAWNPEIYGTTSTGAKVKLAGTPIISATSTSGDFKVFDAPGTIDSAHGTNLLSAARVGADKVQILANKFADPAKTSGSTTLTVTLMGADNKVHTVTTTVTSSTAAPAASSLDVKVKTEKPGIATDSNDKNVIILTEAPGRTYNDILGTTLAKYTTAGIKGTQNVYFAPMDQYGQTASSLSQFVLVSKNVVDTTFTVDTDGTIDATKLRTGDSFVVTGVTKNGLMKTVKIICGTESAVVTPGTGTPATVALNAINSATDTNTMKTALETHKSALGLSTASLNIYNQLSAGYKTTVATAVFNSMPVSGYISTTAVSGAFDAAVASFAAPTGVIVNVGAGTITVVNDTMEYSLDGGSTWTAVPNAATSVSVTFAAGNSVVVRYEAVTGASPKPASLATTPVVVAAAPVAPTGVTASATGLAGTTTAMVYSADAGVTWLPCTATNTTATLTPGNTVLVKIAATATTLESTAVMIAVQ